MANDFLKTVGLIGHKAAAIRTLNETVEGEATTMVKNLALAIDNVADDLLKRLHALEGELLSARHGSPEGSPF